MERFTTNMGAAHAAATTARDTLDQAKREISECGLYVAASDPRAEILAAVERDIRSALDGVVALRRFTQE